MSTNPPFLDKDYYPTDDSRSLLNTENSDDLFTALRDCFATDGIDTTDYINPAIFNTGVYSASTQCRPKPVPDPTNSHGFILPWLNVSQQFPIDMSESTQLPAGSESGTAANESYPICSMEVLRNNVGAVNGHLSRGKRSKSADPSSHSKIHRLKKRRRYGGAKSRKYMEIKMPHRRYPRLHPPAVATGFAVTGVGRPIRKFMAYNLPITRRLS